MENGSGLDAEPALSLRLSAVRLICAQVLVAFTQLFQKLRSRYSIHQLSQAFRSAAGGGIQFCSDC